MAPIRLCNYCSKKYFRGHPSTEHCSDRCRLLEKVAVDRDTGCWVWTAGLTSRKKLDQARPCFRYGGKKVLGHHAAYQIFIGPIPKRDGHHGTVLRHRCDNILCVNPKHLIPGTQAENVKDCQSKQRNARKETHGKAKITMHHARKIRQLWGKTKDLPLKWRYTKKQLGEAFGLSHWTIAQILSGETWAEESA